MLKLQPDLVPLVGGQVGLLVHDLLEFIHKAAVGQEGQTVLRVIQLILGGVRPEKQVVPGAGEKLHAHAVNLAALHAGAGQLAGQVVFHGHVGLEGVARLVGEHVHIARSAVEVGEHERAVAGNGLAVAALGLARTGQHVKGLPLEHIVDEAGGFGA